MNSKIINTKHITIFGDSIAKGLYLDNNLNIKKLDKNLSTIISEENGLDITNNSVFGQSLDRFYNKGTIDNYIESYKEKKKIDSSYTDTVIICLGGNDSDYKWDEVSLNPFIDHQPKTNLNYYEDILSSICMKLKKAGIETILTTIFPIESTLFYNNVLSEKYDGEKIKIFLNNDLTNIVRHQELFNYKIWQVAIKYNLKVIDIRGLFLNERKYIDYVCSDGLHPNQDAQYYIYEQLFNYTSNNSEDYVLEFAY